jgi:hypothetical protein
MDCWDTQSTMGPSAALKDFQQASHLPVTGSLDVATSEALAKSCF